MAEQKKEQPKQQKRIAIEMPKDLKAVYANGALIGITPAEMVVDFVQVLPRTPKGQVMSRVILSPIHAKLLQRALAHNVANFERQFGEIKLPTQPSVADQFFRFSQPGDEKDDGK
jgi:hypothetical protein